MKISEQQTLPFGEGSSISLPVDSPANHTVQQEREKARKMTATSGQKCLEQFGKFNRAGLWAKTFAALLIGMGGLVFDEVQADLEAEGYEVLPFLLPASGVGAPHRRDRIWFVAFNSKFATYGGDKSGKGKGDGLDLGRHMLAAAEWQQGSNNIESSDKNVTNGANAGLESLRPGENKVYESGITSNTKRFGLPVGDDQQDRRDAQSVIERSYGIGDWKDFPTQSPICNRNDGLPSGLADITFSRWRKESIKALGNAIVPQVAYQIFKAIEQYNICQE